MSELYLIAHCVRGEAAFDVATKMQCPHCDYARVKDGGTFNGCFDCDSLGYWWIIPTSGHRAWPYWYANLSECCVEGPTEYESIIHGVPDMPSCWPDHFKSLPAPKVDITSLFRAAQPQQPRIARRL